jgi:hypothetical protein
MWRVIIQCSAESWATHAKEFKAIAAQFPGETIASKKMKGDDRRIMEYRMENVSDAEDFVEACLGLEGFQALFEAL